MIIVRNVFRCKPGRTQALVAKLKASSQAMKAAGVAEGSRILTDLSSTFWTVVLETEAESLEAWERAFSTHGSSAAVRDAMAGYMDLVDGGHREIWKVE